MEKQLLASQKFLQGIRALPTYEAARSKQMQQIENVVSKAPCISTEVAGQLVHVIDGEIWSEDQVVHLKGLISEKITMNTSTTAGRKTGQDYTALCCYLSTEWWTYLQTTQSEGEKVEALTKLGAKLGMRTPSEASLGGIVYLSCCLFGNQNMTEKQKLKLLEEYKPKMRRWIGQVPVCGDKVSDLPEDPQELDSERRNTSFPKGYEPGLLQGLSLSSIMLGIRKYPCRKTNMMTQGPNTMSLAPGSVLEQAGGMQWRQVGELLAGALGATSLERQKSFQPSSPEKIVKKPSVQLLALTNGEEFESQESHASSKVVPNAAEVTPTTVVEPPAVTESRAPTLASQVSALRGQLSLKRPAAASHDKSHEDEDDEATVLKRPAARKATSPKKKPAAALAKPKGQPKKKPQVGLKRKAAPVEDDYRKRLMASIPKTLKDQYKRGCGTCRNRPWCCNSCWHKRGFFG